VDLEPSDFDRLLIELVTCMECGRSVDEFVAIAEHWTYWSDGASQ